MRKKYLTAIILLSFLVFSFYLSNQGYKEEYSRIKAENEVLSLEVSNLNEKIDDYEKLISTSQLTRLKQNKVVNYMYGTATAYHPPSGGINSDDKPEVTSIGLPAKEGIIAVNPSRIPYGSQVMIISGKTVIRGIAGDTGGAMRQNPSQVDILMDSKEKAMEWGQKKGVHIIWWEDK